eukprot:scaffold10848_cov57-Phaeocystis_antarctica.AAC.6
MAGPPRPPLLRRWSPRVSHGRRSALPPAGPARRGPCTRWGRAAQIRSGPRRRVDRARPPGRHARSRPAKTALPPPPS